MELGSAACQLFVSESQLFVSELEEGHANQSNHANQLFVSELEESNVFA